MCAYETIGTVNFAGTVEKKEVFRHRCEWYARFCENFFSRWRQNGKLMTLLLFSLWQQNY